MKFFFYVTVFNFCFITFSFAQVPIDLKNHDESSYIGSHVSRIEDKDGRYTIQAIASLSNDHFTSEHDNIINLGFSKSVFWLKFVVKNKDSINNWVLEIKYPPLDSITFYYKGVNGSWEAKNDGDNWSVAKRDVDSRNFAFKLRGSGEAITEYYLKIKSTSAITIPLKIQRNDFFIKESLKAELFYGICYGIMIIMLLYNLIIYFATKDKSYVYYALHALFSILFYSLFYGHVIQYVIHVKSPYINYVNLYVIGFLGISFILFVKSFLNILTTFPLINRILNLLIALLLICFLIAPFNIGLASGFSIFLILLMTIFAWIAGIISLKRGNREARFFVLASSFHVFSIVATILRVFTLLPANDSIMDALIVSNVVEIAFLSLALADKIAIYRNQKLKAQAQVILLKQQESQILEQKVKERTMQLEQANEEISVINEDLKAFSYSAAHDLRTPLRSIIGFGTLLDKTSGAVLTKESKELLDVIQSSAKNMDRLIEDLLAYSHLGKKELVKEEINMKDFVESIIIELGARSEKEQVIDIKVGDLKYSVGDLALLKQVWINLISNAIKYSSRKSKAEIKIDSKSNEKEVVYCIKDHGDGFDMKYADKLFEPFKRLHGQSEFEGTGLGLSIVKKIITKHGGRVWVEAIKGEGATFYFSLPNNSVQVIAK